MECIISKENAGAETKFVLGGSLTIYNVARLRVALTEELRLRERVSLDLAQIEEIDSAGIQLLMYLRNEARRLGKQLELRRHSAIVLRILDLYGLAGFFGDRLVVPANERGLYNFSYGVRKR